MSHREHTSNALFFSEEISLSGHLRTDAPVHFNGTFTGEFSSTACLIIGEKASVDANVIAASVILGGSFLGNMTLGESLEITSTGRFRGKLIQKTPSLIVAAGGLFAGELFDERGNPHVAEDVSAPLRVPPPGSEEGRDPVKRIVALYDID